MAALDSAVEFRRQETLLKKGALQDAIFDSAYFSCIATDERGVIQIFNVGAERMLGFVAADVINRLTPADISDPAELIARAAALSLELQMPVKPGFEALVCKASRDIEDSYELTYVRKDGSRFAAIVSVTSLRDAEHGIIGYLLIGTDNTTRKRLEAEQTVLDQRLRDQQFYTRSLLEANIDALMATDTRGIISDVNQQMVNLTGRTRDELIGAPCRDFFTDPVRADAAIKRVLIENKVTLGHDMGDLLLKQVAGRLSTCVREVDTVARFAGDEFVVVLEGLSENSKEASTQAECVGNKILTSLNKPYYLCGHGHRSTPSIGVTLFANDHSNVDELMKQADLAMYEAKAGGRNAMHFFDTKI